MDIYNPNKQVDSENWLETTRPPTRTLTASLDLESGRYKDLNSCIGGNNGYI
jgi:hypothetical protein